MNIFKLLTICFFSLLIMNSCTDLELTSPNQETTDSFWKTEDDAINGINATYSKLQDIGTYGRWLYFAYDNRSDLSLSNSPWTDLSNFSKFTFSTFDIAFNVDIWKDQFQGVFRANQVIQNVQPIEMDEGLKQRIIGEAKFLRGLMYFNLVNLYGNVPIILEIPEPNDRPSTSSIAEVWEQVIKDFKEAKAVLPIQYDDSNEGRATRDAASAMLGKSYLQLNRWEEAAQEFELVINSPKGYELLENFGDNFFQGNNNLKESVFEIQFTDDSRLSAGVKGNNRPRFLGPRGPSFADGQPTRWFFNQFMKEKTVDGKIDPRLDVTIFFNREGGMDVFGTPFKERYGEDSNELFWKKHTQFWQTNQDFDSPLNYIVIRFSDVLLMYAEALNELGRTDEAIDPINRVRARVNMAPLQPGMTQSEMRKQIEHERIVELGGESLRFLYLKRHNLLSTELTNHDPEFEFFQENRDELLPVPQTELDLNPNLKQNPGF